MKNSDIILVILVAVLAWLVFSKTVSGWQEIQGAGAVLKVGNMISKTYSKSYDACKSACQSNNECTHFDHYKGKCQLFRGQPQTYAYLNSRIGCKTAC